jgi:hypothetical protein
MIRSDSWTLVTSDSFNTKYRDLDISIIQNNNSTYTLRAIYKLGDIFLAYERKELALTLDGVKLEAESLVASAYRDAPVVDPVTPLLRPTGIPTPPPRPRRTTL